jgi:hypothetical protein
MDEQEHSAEPAPPASPAPSESPDSLEASATSPMTAPAGEQPGRGRAEHARQVLTSRGAGWVVATALAGAVVALSVILATASPAAVVAERVFVAGPGLRGPAAVSPIQLPSGAVRVQLPPGMRSQVHGWVISRGPAGQVSVHLLAPACRGPAGAQVQLPAGAQVQLPAGAQVQFPAGGRVKLPAGGQVQLPAAGQVKLPAVGQVQLPPTVRVLIPARVQAGKPVSWRVALRPAPACLSVPAG